MMHRRLFFLIFLSLLAACNPDTLNDFDKNVWIQDPKGCKNERIKLLESVEKQKDRLLDLSQAEIVGLLGKPDAQELLKRNAKNFTYFVAQGSQCGKGSQKGTALVIHFGALNYVSEISRNHY